MEKSGDLQIVDLGKNVDIHRMDQLPVVCLPVYKEIVKEMAELIEDRQTREVFCSLSSGKDLQSISQTTGISSKNLISIYKRGLRQIHLKWKPYSKFKQELDHIYISNAEIMNFF